MLETCFLFPNVSRSECAAWTQAWGSILAIFAAFIVAGFQARAQARTSIDALKHQRLQEQRRLAGALKELAISCKKLASAMVAKLDDREKVGLASETGLPFDMPELERLERALDAIPLHDLPGDFVTPALVLSSTVRQFRIKVDMALRGYRQMDAKAFEDFFGSTRAMRMSVDATVIDFESLIRNLDEAAG